MFVPRVYVANFDDDTVDELLGAVGQAVAERAPCVYLTICSGGGSVYHMSAMLDVIRTAPVPIVTCAIGHAQSAAAWLLAGGAKGQRYVAPHATVMVHDGRLHIGDHVDIRELKELSDKWTLANEADWSWLDEMTGKKKGTWSRRAQKEGKDITLTAKQAVAEGIADKIGIPWFRMGEFEMVGGEC